MSQHPSFQMTAEQWADSCTLARNISKTLHRGNHDLDVIEGNVIYLRDKDGQRYLVTVTPEKD